MGLYCPQVFQQLQLTSSNSTLSTLTQYLSEQSSDGSSLLYVQFCTPRQHYTAVYDFATCEMRVVKMIYCKKSRHRRKLFEIHDGSVHK